MRAARSSTPESGAGVEDCVAAGGEPWRRYRGLAAAVWLSNMVRVLCLVAALVIGLLAAYMDVAHPRTMLGLAYESWVRVLPTAFYAWAAAVFFSGPALWFVCCGGAGLHGGGELGPLLRTFGTLFDNHGLVSQLDDALARVSASELAALGPSEREALYRILATGGQAGNMQRVNRLAREHLAATAIDAVVAMGDARAVPALERLAGRARAGAALRDKAREAIQLLPREACEGLSGAVLLRPSAPPAADLLHPADGAGGDEGDQLGRPAGPPA